MRFAVLLPAVLIGACAGVEQETRPAAAPATRPPAANPWSEQARQVLVEHCGVCHVGTLPSARPAALRIYDLSEPAWDARLKPENYPGITRRVNRQANEAQKAVVEKYLRCARDGACAES